MITSIEAIWYQHSTIMADVSYRIDSVRGEPGCPFENGIGRTPDIGTERDA